MHILTVDCAEITGPRQPAHKIMQHKIYILTA